MNFIRLPHSKTYLDIDGVLLTAKNTRAAEDVVSFLQCVTERFDCYWLTTHSKGNSQTAVRYVSNFIQDCGQLLKRIKPTNWNTLKTEAIDFDSDLYWLDDYPMMAEKQVLAKHKRDLNLITVNLNRTNELKNIMRTLLR